MPVAASEHCHLCQNELRVIRVAPTGFIGTTRMLYRYLELVFVTEPRFGVSSERIGMCDRCEMAFPLGELEPD